MLEPRHVAALLVDRHDRVGAVRAHRGGELGDLVALGDVTREKDGAAEAALEPRAQPVRRRQAVKSRQQAGRREAFELGAQPLTAPDVRPNAIFRCTSRKKIMTGSAMSVAPAMSPPQSVLRLVPV